MAKVTIQLYNSLEEAAADGDFFVINNSDGRGVRMKGQVIFNILARDGAARTIVIPPTWMPIDLKNYLSAEDISASTLLRDYVRRQILVLCKKESFDDLRAHPDYQKEFERVNKIVGSVPTMATEMEINVGVGNAVTAENDARGIQPVKTPIVEMIMNSNGDQELIDNFDKALRGLSIGELHYLSTVAPRGSLTSLIATELESNFTSGNPVESVKDTEAFNTIMKTGRTQGPQMSF